MMWEMASLAMLKLFNSMLKEICFIISLLQTIPRAILSISRLEKGVGNWRWEISLCLKPLGAPVRQTIVGYLDK